MRQNGLNWHLSAGLLLTAIMLGVNHFVELPHFLYGLGLGIALELAGAWAVSHDMKKIREFKKKALHIFAK